MRKSLTIIALILPLFAMCQQRLGLTKYEAKKFAWDRYDIPFDAWQTEVEDGIEIMEVRVPAHDMTIAFYYDMGNARNNEMLYVTENYTSYLKVMREVSVDCISSSDEQLFYYLRDGVGKVKFATISSLYTITFLFK